MPDIPGQNYSFEFDTKGAEQVTAAVGDIHSAFDSLLRVGLRPLLIGQLFNRTVEFIGTMRKLDTQTMNTVRTQAGFWSKVITVATEAGFAVSNVGEDYEDMATKANLALHNLDMSSEDYLSLIGDMSDKYGGLGRKVAFDVIPQLLATRDPILQSEEDLNTLIGTFTLFESVVPGATREATQLMYSLGGGISNAIQDFYEINAVARNFNLNADRYAGVITSLTRSLHEFGITTQDAQSYTAYFYNALTTRNKELAISYQDVGAVVQNLMEFRLPGATGQRLQFGAMLNQAFEYLPEQIQTALDAASMETYGVRFRGLEPFGMSDLLRSLPQEELMNIRRSLPATLALMLTGFDNLSGKATDAASMLDYVTNRSEATGTDLGNLRGRVTHLYDAFARMLGIPQKEIETTDKALRARDMERIATGQTMDDIRTRMSKAVEDYEGVLRDSQKALQHWTDTVLASAKQLGSELAVPMFQRFGPAATGVVGGGIAGILGAAGTAFLGKSALGFLRNLFGAGATKLSAAAAGQQMSLLPELLGKTGSKIGARTVGRTATRLGGSVIPVLGAAWSVKELVEGIHDLVTGSTEEAKYRLLGGAAGLGGDLAALFAPVSGGASLGITAASTAGEIALISKANKLEDATDRLREIQAKEKEQLFQPEAFRQKAMIDTVNVRGVTMNMTVDNEGLATHLERNLKPAVTQLVREEIKNYYSQR